MATWEQVKEWNVNGIAQIGDALAAARKKVTALQDEIDDAAAPAEWSGAAADAAAQELRRRRQELELLAAEIAAMGAAVDDAEGAVQRLRQDIEETEAAAAAQEFTIDGVGRVLDRAEAADGSGLGRTFVQVELVGRVAAVLASAEAIDADLTAVIDKILGGEIIDGDASTLADAAEAGALQADDRLHDELLAKYQVSPDPDGMTEWPSGALGWMWEQLGNKPNPVTATEAEMLDRLQIEQGLLGVKELADIRQDALHRGENVFDGQGVTDGHADAFRHAYWNALMAQRYGEDWAAEFATAHERNPDSHATPVAMDLHNNEVGRRIAMENPDASPDELAALVEQAVRDGEMVVVGQDDKLVRSDQVDFGETRQTGPDNEWPTDNPEREGHATPEDPSAYPERGY